MTGCSFGASIRALATHCIHASRPCEPQHQDVLHHTRTPPNCLLTHQEHSASLFARTPWVPLFRWQLPQWIYVYRVRAFLHVLRLLHSFHLPQSGPIMVRAHYAPSPLGASAASSMPFGNSYPAYAHESWLKGHSSR